MLLCKSRQLIKFHGPDIHALRILGNSRIAGRTVYLVRFFTLGHLPGNRMLASAASND